MNPKIYPPNLIPNLYPSELVPKLCLVEKDELTRLRQIEKRYKLLTTKAVRQGVELDDCGGFKLDKSPTQALMRFNYWCTLEKLNQELDNFIAENDAWVPLEEIEMDWPSN